MAKRTTIHDIAKELNLTSASVSRALNDHPRISVETKQKVAAKAVQMNYRRNKLASSLRSGKSHTIGIIIPSAQMNFFGSVVHGIENMASNNGYSIILYQSEESTLLEKKAIETFLSARVDGILASIAKETVDFAHFEELKKRNIPLVFFDRTNDNLKIPSVVVDDYKGGFLATEHLIKNGYERIAHVSGPQHIKGFHDRTRGYMDALEHHKIKFDKRLIYAGDISIESGKAAIEYFFNLQDVPDSVFAVEDFTALGVIKGLKERKISMPDRFGVIGFANESFGEYITPSLSSVDQQTVQMGREAFGLLMSIIKVKDGNKAIAKQEKIVLEPVLHLRESSAGKIKEGKVERFKRRVTQFS
ncbi:MAG TPA: LacI family DNA-binding transcriptional regulator [Panacibacter sp.]|nr:LacI family DNA-binding transcriptional regulator [Panacibacter sp.]